MNKSKINRFIALVLVLVVVKANSQTYDEIIKRYSQAVTESTNFQAKLTYSVYENLETTPATENLEGITAKLGTDFYSKIGPTEFLYKEGVAIKVSNAEKALVLSEYGEKNANISASLDVNIFEKFDLEKLEDKSTFWVCHLKAKKSSSFISKDITICIDKKTYLMTKQVVYFTQELYTDIENEDTEKQRLEITYGNYEPVNDSIKEKFLMKNYVLLENKKYKPVKDYKSYKLHNFLSKLN